VTASLHRGKYLGSKVIYNSLGFLFAHFAVIRCTTVCVGLYFWKLLQAYWWTTMWHSLHLSAKVTEIWFIYSMHTDANMKETAETSQEGKYFSIHHINNSVSAYFW